MEIDVPKEIEVEEVQQKEVVKNVTEEKKVPQVETWPNLIRPRLI